MGSYVNTAPRSLSGTGEVMDEGEIERDLSPCDFCNKSGKIRGSSRIRYWCRMCGGSGSASTRQGWMKYPKVRTSSRPPYIVKRDD